MCQKAIQLTPKGEKLNKILMIMFFIEVILTILRVIFERYDILFSSIIAAILLLVSFLTCHYFLLMFLFFFSMFTLFFTIVFLGLRIQNAVSGDYDKYLNETFYQAGLGIECVVFIFMCILIYFIYKAYTEYKAIALGYQPNNSNSYQSLNQNDIERGRNNESNGGVNNNAPSAINSSNQNSNGYNAFSGQGYVVGES